MHPDLKRRKNADYPPWGVRLLQNKPLDKKQIPSTKGLRGFGISDVLEEFSFPFGHHSYRKKAGIGKGVCFGQYEAIM